MIKWPSAPIFGVDPPKWRAEMDDDEHYVFAITL